MAKKKERSEHEFLRAENRKLKSMVRHLKKELQRTNKRKQRYEDLEEREADQMLDDLEEENQHISKTHTCPMCKDDLEELVLGNRVLYLCECGYKTPSKKIQNGQDQT